MNSKKRTLLILIIISIIFSTIFINCVAKSNSNFGKKEITIISKYGKHEEYPACSVPAIIAAKNNGADGILLNIFKTTDNILIASMSDELADFTDQNGKISQKSFNEIKNIKLKNGPYKSFEKNSEHTLIPFTELMDKTKDLMLTFYINISYENIPLLKKIPNKNIVILNSKNDTRIETLHEEFDIASSKPYNKPVKHFIKTKKIFSDIIFIEGKNPYGPAFSKSALNDKSVSYGIDMTISEKCGKRKDETLSFDNIISKGYSLIITDNVCALKSYKNRSKAAANELLKEIIFAENKFNCNKKSTTLKSLKSSVSKAKNIYINSNCVSELEMIKTELKKAEKAFSDKPEGKTATLTPIRILAAVGISIAFIIIEILFYRIRKWSDGRRIKEIED